MIATTMMVGDGYGCGERKDDEAGWGWPGRLGSATDVCGTTTKESDSWLATGVDAKRMMIMLGMKR